MMLMLVLVRMLLVNRLNIGNRLCRMMLLVR